MSAAVSIYIYDRTPSVQSRLYRVTQLRTDGVHCRESVVSKHNHCCTADVHTVDPFFPPDLCLYKRRRFSVHGTVRVTQLRTDGVHCGESVVSKHNHCCTADVHTVDPFFSSRLMSVQA